jgi:hypothetical protein
MTLAATSRLAGPFDGTGALVNYPFTFKVFAAADVEVTLRDSTGLEQVAVDGSTCLVTVNADQDGSPGGYVRYAVGGVATALPSGTSLTITGAGLAYTQTADLPAAGNFNPTTVENALDRNTMLVQLIRDEVARALQVSVSTPAGFNATLPVPSAGQILGWNGAGTGFANYPVGTAEGSALAIALADTTTAAKGDALVGYGGIVSTYNGVLTRHASLAAAVSFIGATRCTVIVSKDTTMAASATFPATSTLKIVNRAQITTTGFTLTINGHFKCPPVQCFAGTGAVVMARSAPATVYCEWWGAVADDTTDSKAAMQAASDALTLTGDSGRGMRIDFLSGIYKIGGPVLWPNGITLSGAGRQQTTIRPTAGFSGGSTMFGDKGNGSKIFMRHFRIEAFAVAAVTDVIKLGYGGTGPLAQCELYDLYVAWSYAGGPAVAAGTKCINITTNVASLTEIEAGYAARSFNEGANSGTTCYTRCFSIAGDVRGGLLHCRNVDRWADLLAEQQRDNKPLRNRGGRYRAPGHARLQALQRWWCVDVDESRPRQPFWLPGKLG